MNITENEHEEKSKSSSKLDTSSKWMSCPKVETEHPGLAYICTLDELIIAEKVDALHELIGNKGTAYTIFNNHGQKVFLAVHEQKYRKFRLKVYNYYGNEVIYVKRPFKFCVNRVLVWAPPGHFVGSVIQARSCKRTFSVKNQLGKVVLKITSSGLYHFVYDIESADGKVGMVMKECHLKGLGDVRNFGVSFPINMAVEEKAVLLGACFLIGYLNYRNKCC